MIFLIKRVLNQHPFDLRIKLINLKLKVVKEMKTKIIIGIAFIAMLLLPISAQFTSAQSDKIVVEDKPGMITITTEYITFKFTEGRPNFSWWNGNTSTSDEVYNVHFMEISEYFGEDEILDGLNELVGGLSYNLFTSVWSTEVVEEDDEVTITMTMTGLANDVELQFIVHIYTTDQVIPGTDSVVEGLTEIKFDIVVNNWQFSEGAQGLGIKAQIHESQRRNRVRLRSGSEDENGNRSRLMNFESDEYNNAVVAYYEWTTFADVYDGLNKIDTIEVGTTYFNADMPGPGEGPIGEEQEIVNQWLTYPNYGDSLTLVHDPSVGVDPAAISNNISLYILPLIGGILAPVLVVSLVRRKKH